MRHPLRLAPCLLVAALVGCAHDPGDAAQAGAAGNGRAGGTAFVEGEARVVSVDEPLGQAVLEIDGHRFFAYWQVEVARPQSGEVVDQGQLKPRVGQYKEPMVRLQRFPAKPGDRVWYRGLQTGPDLFLRGVQILGR